MAITSKLPFLGYWAGASVLLDFVVKETVGDACIRVAEGWIASNFGIGEAVLVATIATYSIPIFIAWLIVRGTYRLGQRSHLTGAPGAARTLSAPPSRRWRGLFRLGSHAERMPLFEAATRVYEQIEDHLASSLVEIFADTGDERLINVCDILLRPQDRKPLIRLFGNHSPSGEIKEIYTDPRDRYHFIVEGKTIIFSDNGDRFENLCVPVEDINPAIRSLRERLPDDV
jgi:hypothetical protein